MTARLYVPAVCAGRDRYRVDCADCGAIHLTTSLETQKLPCGAEVTLFERPRRGIASERIVTALYLALETIRDGACSCGSRSCVATGKHPVRQIHPHGVDDAAPYDQIRPFVDDCAYNLGLAMGFATTGGEVVHAIDIDPRSDGDDTILALQIALGDLPLTRTASTGGGGSHYLVSVPAGVRLPGSMGAGVDIKSAGGYIVISPSRHLSGGVYRWVNREPVASLPASWIERFASRDHGTFDAAPTGDVASSWLGIAFASAGWLGRQLDATRIAVRCPRRHLHTDGRGGDGAASDTVIMSPTTRAQLGAFRCMHSNACSDLTTEKIVTDYLPYEAGRTAMVAHPTLSPLICTLFQRARKRP